MEIFVARPISRTNQSTRPGWPSRGHQGNEPSEAIKVVGVFQALDGNMDAQQDDLVERATEWGIMIRDGWVP